jgi:hypothetical protein
MKLILKIFFICFLFFFTTEKSFAQQNEMFKEKKERKRIWKRWRKDREAYNPYVKAKASKKPSARMAKGDRKELKRQKRAAKKQMKRNKKSVNN